MKNSRFNLKVKEVLDKVLSIVLLLLTSWLILIIIILYLLSLDFPILFKQQRIGKDEKLFKLYKFRTLENSNKPLQQRKFLLGSLLRLTSLDELPQLINVLKGEMALVGPRPLPTDYLLLFSESQRKRHNVLPGITGLAQVNGRNALSWEEKFKLDIYYVNNISFALDFKIWIKTIVLIFSFKKDVSLIEQKFTGSSNE